MEVLRKQRMMLRGSVSKHITKVSGALESLEDGNNQELNSLFSVLEERFTELSTKDGEFVALWLEEDIKEDELSKEQDKIDSYAIEFARIKGKVEERLHKQGSPSHGSVYEDVGSQHSGSSAQGMSSSNSKCKLPKLELKKFDGELQNWLTFWSSFEKIDKDDNMDPSDKLSYLSMCMVVGSPAEKLVLSYPQTGNMYAEVLVALKARYGRPDLLTEFYIRELLKIVILNSKSKLSVGVLYDKLQCHLRNLNTLGVTSDNCASILMPLVSSCLPEELLQIWERNCHIAVSKDKLSSKDYLDNLLTFLQAEVEATQKLEMARSGFGLKEPRYSKPVERYVNHPTHVNPPLPTAAALTSSNTEKYKLCIFCDSDNHKSLTCKKFLNMTVSEKTNLIREKRACFFCLKVGHLSFRCRNKPKCGKCKGSHLEVMCPGLTKTEDVGKTSSTMFQSCRNTVLLQTTVVKVVNESSGSWQYARLMVDTGSQQSYVLNKTVANLDYKPIGKETIQHALFGGSVTNPVDHNVYKIVLNNVEETYRCAFNVLSQDTICSPIPIIPPGPWIAELEQANIQLSDTNYPTAEIEILVGADEAGKLYTGRRKILSCGLVAMETMLGWTLSGKVPGSKPSGSMANVVTSLFVQQAPISDLWSLDVIGIRDPTDSGDIERDTLDHFLATVKINSENRYEIRLPFISEHPPLPSNYGLAKKRLDNTIQKLRKDGYHDDYQRVLDDWEEKGIIEKVSQEQMSIVSHYLPHRHVIKVNSTTPVRPVFDASAHGAGLPSLNECLEKGPNLIEKIPACLARFRKKRVAVSGDIAKAFLQISVDPEDRDFLRFLWNDGNKYIVYRHCRLVFGVSPSPFILEATIQLHLEDVLKRCDGNQTQWLKSQVEQLKDSFYVDNCLTSLNSLSEARDFTVLASDIMRERQFDLRGWELSYDNSTEATNVLGLLWTKDKDVLSVNIESLKNMEFDKITKRVILSAAHRLFDPIGFTCCVALIPKLLLQETWLQNLAWNEPVSEEVEARFLKWYEDVLLLAEVKIPRWILWNDDEAEYSLHVFSDASGAAYAAVIFLRVETRDCIQLRLLAAKARVAPKSKATKPMTIPRLELLAASIGCRLHASTVRDLKLEHVKTTFWTDASTVLAWVLRQEPWNVFIMNRVKEIRTLSKECEWRHVPGSMNPADLPSRGCTAKKLIECRWWEGPPWLLSEPGSWPQQEAKVDEDEVIKERRKTVVSAVVVSDSSWYQFTNNYTKLIRVMAWVRRLKSNVEIKKTSGTLPEPHGLTVEEFRSAELMVFRLIQKESPEEMKKMDNTVTIMEDGLLRLKSRVSFREDDHSFRFPIVLPGKHPVVRNMILAMHKEHCHAGAQTLLAIVREKFWLIGGRKVMRSILSSCVVCKRYSAHNVQPEPIPLPEPRVRDAKTFEVVGVDLAGPLFVKDNSDGSKKVWVCIFACAVYRAVRLELVWSLTTDSFIQVLRRFISKNGRPQIIYSDNGTNFVGFNNASNKLN
ncbi:hypothetical protein M8J77_015657 [Diaphorina citri]|nr:hypothetical protein M8J77_015657 [Diaphorina citri]